MFVWLVRFVVIFFTFLVGVEMKKKLFAVGCAALTAFLAAGCGKLDVVATDSVRAFGEVLEALPDGARVNTTVHAWVLDAPDGAASFTLAPDPNVWPFQDVWLSFDSAPFVAAGLDVTKLPEGISASGGLISIGTKLGLKETARAGDGDATALVSYERIVKQSRKSIGYHGALDHYGVSLGDGNLFEWAKDMSANDKDMVFVLNPAPFIAAGVDPNKVEGWVFGKVTVDDENGKPIEVDKLLKPFNLK
jgi:hypothetical protein